MFAGRSCRTGSESRLRAQHFDGEEHVREGATTTMEDGRMSADTGGGARDNG